MTERLSDEQVHEMRDLAVVWRSTVKRGQLEFSRALHRATGAKGEGCDMRSMQDSLDRCGSLAHWDLRSMRQKVCKMIDEKSLRERIAIAKAATPGHWRVNRYWRRLEMPVHPNAGYTGSYALFGEWPPDLDHVAANSPDAVIELCEALLAAHAEIALLKDKCDEQWDNGFHAAVRDIDD